MNRWVSNKLIPPMWAQLHVGNPGRRGTDNISFGNVERKLWTPGGVPPEWENTGGVTERITDVTLWDQPAFGYQLVWVELDRPPAHWFWGQDHGVEWRGGHSFLLRLSLSVCAA